MKDKIGDTCAEFCEQSPVKHGDVQHTQNCHVQITEQSSRFVKCSLTKRERTDTHHSYWRKISVLPE